MKKLILSVAIIAMPSFALAQQFPEPTWTPVNPSTTTTPSTETAQCTQWEEGKTVTYACGTKKVPQKVKVMDSPTTFHYETIWVEVEKTCEKTLPGRCVKWN